MENERPVTAQEVNAFIAEAGGKAVSAKDFRAFQASASALACLAETNDCDRASTRKEALLTAADAASRMLVNTRNVARTSYIHLSVIKAYEAARLEARLLGGRVRQGLTRIESAFLRFLESSRTH